MSREDLASLYQIIDTIEKLGMSLEHDIGSKLRAGNILYQCALAKGMIESEIGPIISSRKVWGKSNET